MNKISILTVLSLFLSNFSHLVSASSRSRINGRRGALAKELAKLKKSGELKTKPGKIQCAAGTYLNSSSKTCISCNNGT